MLFIKVLKVFSLFRKVERAVRINAYNRVSKIYEAQNISNVKNVKEVTAKQDEVEISKLGRDISAVREAVNKTPDIRLNKVNDIIGRIELGAYDIDAKEVANKIVDKYFDETI